MALALGAVQALAHFLSGLEEWDALLLHRYVRSGAGIAAGPRRTVLDRKSAEATQFDAVAARHRRDELVDNGIEGVLDIALVQMRVLRDMRCTSSDLIIGGAVSETSCDQVKVRAKSGFSAKPILSSHRQRDPTHGVRIPRTGIIRA